MLNIMVSNDNGLFEYEWKSRKQFLDDMSSANEDIPNMEDYIITLDTELKSLNEEQCKELGISTVEDLFDLCQRNEYYNADSDNGDYII